MHVARALWLEPHDEFLERRRRAGLDKWDEVWQGVLHMVPPPTFDHNLRQNDLQVFLTRVVRDQGLGVVVPGTGVRAPGSGLDDYRVPDISVLSAARPTPSRGFIEDGPDLVVEIRSPADETYEKFEFYAHRGVHELLVVDRDTGRPELYRLAGLAYIAVSPDAEGWLPSDRFPVAFRIRGARLEAQDRGAPGCPVHAIAP